MKPWLRMTHRHLARRPGRTALTVLGVASALFLHVAIESLGDGLDQAVKSGDAARTLIVYRQNRYCPQTSFLPETYVGRIESVAGVESVLPVKVYLSNCRPSLDVVAFHGAPADTLLSTRDVDVVDGDIERFRREKATALVGQEFAGRRGLSPGDRFRFGDVTVDVAGIFRSENASEEGLVLTHLEFLQRSGPVDRLGTVTQFEVKIEDADDAERIAREIDTQFENAEEPTDTRPRVAFLGDATRELREIVRFARIFGLICVLIVIVLVANTVLLSIRERRNEHGLILSLGYGARDLVTLVLLETFLLTAAGAVLGLAAAFLVIRFSHLAIGVEGVVVSFAWSAAGFLRALLIATAASALAGALPAALSARSDVQRLLRSA